MKLYLRRQALSATKGIISKRTEISYSLYARLDFDEIERALMEEYGLGGEIVGSHEGLIYGEKQVSLSRDNLMVHSYNVAELVQGKDISCLSFVNMMGLERSLLDGARGFALVLEHAGEIKQNSEAVYDLSDVRPE